MVEPPAYGPEYDWLWVVKYIGYGFSILLLVIFIAVVFINPFLWEMFHIIRCNTGFCILVANICMFVAENESIRKARHDNITISVFQQYWFLASSLSLLGESFATFRAITGGIIGGKTWGYLPMIYGLPMVDIGVTMFLYGSDYGRDPRAFIGRVVLIFKKYFFEKLFYNRLGQRNQNGIFLWTSCGMWVGSSTLCHYNLQYIHTPNKKRFCG